MAESILFNIATKILVSLGQHAIQDVVSCWGVQGDFENLEETVRFIKGRIRDAENRHDEERSEAIKEWLGRLRQVLYRADDLFDDISTMIYRQQRANRRKPANQVCIMVSSSNPFISSRKIAIEIKFIREALDGIKLGMDGLNLRECLPHQESLNRLVVGRETGSFVKVSSVIGRENDKIKILDMLFSPKYVEEDVSVVPIVGFGGLGKTTLAQLVFNDERVQKHFDIAKWVCVPDINNQKEVIGKILNALSGMSYHNLSREQIESKLRLAVKDKKFLLVLDDIWDESRHRWLELFSLMQCANHGSKIIVTTRSDVVASNVGTVHEAYKLGLLTHEESWSLFKKIAFKHGQEESNPNFSLIGREIVQNCGNVPLAIRVVGSLLYPQHTEKEWEIFRDTQLSKAKLMDLGNILPLLKLSYDYLPSALKPCFAYCSLFPKDYEFRNSELVHLWMAQGYVEPLEESRMEDVGDQYFRELLRRNFFHEVKKDELSNVIRFKMHDLMHDLALCVAGDEIFILEGSNVQFTNRLVHVYVCQRGGEFRKAPLSLLSAKNLRSLVLDGYDTKTSSYEKLVLGFGSLRALQNSWIEVVPNSIGRLRHLRYLNFSYSDIKYLPSSITQLYNLQTLILDDCRKLKELPRGFTKLANLRHLGISDCPFTEMPQNFGRMKALREVNKFIIGKNNGLDALTDLNLRGELRIAYRRWRTNSVPEAKRANLIEKKNLVSLSFAVEYQAVATRDEEMLLESLQLPSSLKYLYFSGLRGNNFPHSMLKELPKLVKVYIQRCDSCRVLPLFSGLPLLKYLVLEMLNTVEYVEEANEESSSSTYFPALESLRLDCMQELKSWAKLEDEDRHYYVLPRLRTLEILHCRKLTTLPSMPNLESLSVRNIEGHLLESILTSSSPSPSLSSSTPTLKDLHIESVDLTSLNLRYQYLIKELVITNCGSLRNTSNGIRYLSTLEELRIYCCKDLDAWDASDGTRLNAWGGLKSLHSLVLSNMPMELLPDGITCLTMLQKLSISNLKNLTGLHQKIGNLSRLQDFSVYYCPKLTALPQSFSDLKCLQKLVIRCCPDLEKRCERPDGQDWALVQHIPTVLLSDRKMT